MSVKPDKVIRLYPYPSEELDLNGLYLTKDLREVATRDRAMVYTNYIVSLDGRIAIKEPCTDKARVPPAITNAKDWRLYQELAAQADVLLTTGRYIREMVESKKADDFPVSTASQFADLLNWREQHGLTPQPAVAVLSQSMDLPFEQIRQRVDRPVYVITGNDVSEVRLKQAKLAGVKVLQAGEGKRVQGKAMVKALVDEGFVTMYAIAGPKLLETLIVDQMLDRLYLTQVNRLLGGREFDTLLESAQLEPPADFVLLDLYLDQEEDSGLNQTFAVYELCPCDEG
jgi:riboflavin biosynthesis pyrimidine reductase